MKITFNLGLTEILAFWGSVVSTIAIILNIRRWLMDRRRLSVEANIGRMLPTKQPDKLYFYVAMTNIGRRPIFVKSYGIVPQRRKGEKGKVFSMIVARDLPKMLTEGEYHLEYTDQLDFGGREVIGVFVLDSTGKYWMAGRKNLKALKSDLIEARKNQSA